MYAGKGRPCAFDSGGHVGVRRLKVFELNLFVSSSHIHIGPGDTTAMMTYSSNFTSHIYKVHSNDFWFSFAFFVTCKGHFKSRVFL